MVSNVEVVCFVVVDLIVVVIVGDCVVVYYGL